MSEMEIELHDEIMQFLSSHAKQAASYDPEFDEPEDRYNGPDSAMLHAAAEAIKHGTTPMHVHSDWGSGCYAPYNDADARAWHDRLVTSVNRLSHR